MDGYDVSDYYYLHVPPYLYQKGTTDRTVTFLPKELVISNSELAVCMKFLKTPPVTSMCHGVYSIRVV